MQTKDQLKLVTIDLFQQLKADNVVYAEIRFAPLLHTAKGLSAFEVVETVNLATEECVREYGIEAGIILSTLRHYSEVESMETVQLAKALKEPGLWDLTSLRMKQDLVSPIISKHLNMHINMAFHVQHMQVKQRARKVFGKP
jgi:adenosine deaminase